MKCLSIERMKERERMTYNEDVDDFVQHIGA